MLRRVLPTPTQVYRTWRSNLGYDPVHVADCFVSVAQQKMKKPFYSNSITIDWKDVIKTYSTEFPQTIDPSFYNEAVRYEVNKILKKSGWMAKWESPGLGIPSNIDIKPIKPTRENAATCDK